MGNTESVASVTAVTGFFDVGRASLDGRTPQKYVEWLNQTLTIPLPFLIFLDPSFDASGITLKSGDRIIRVAKSDLKMFEHKAAVENILSTSDSVNRRDISFNLAEYGMIVMSKPELLKRAARETKAQALVWIDAGHCRFIADLSNPKFKLQASALDGLNIGMNITKFLAQRIRLGKFPRSLVGRCLAMMTAEDFIVARSFAEELSDRIDFLVEKEWLPNGRWDNEQVALGCLLFRGGLPGARVLQTVVSGGGNTARWLFGLPPKFNPLPFYVAWRMFLDEFRTRFTARDACYLPNDFPELEFQKFVQERNLAKDRKTAQA